MQQASDSGTGTTRPHVLPLTTPMVHAGGNRSGPRGRAAADIAHRWARSRRRSRCDLQLERNSGCVTRLSKRTLDEVDLLVGDVYGIMKIHTARAAELLECLPTRDMTNSNRHAAAGGAADRHVIRLSTYFNPLEVSERCQRIGDNPA